MKMKFITAIVAFSITFGFSAFVAELFGANGQLHSSAGENNRTGQEISSLLRQDIENGQEMDAACQSGASFYEYSEAVSEYAADSAAIEDVNLPPDFRFAWQAHMDAWRGHADFLEQNNYRSEELTEIEFFQKYSKQTSEIKRTWLNVLNIAKKYGAVIPPNAY